jgi:hypothetical protein
MEMEPKDYKNRTYLSAIEAAKFLGISVRTLHNLVNRHVINAKISASGQMRFDLEELKISAKNFSSAPTPTINIDKINVIEINGTTQKILVKNSMRMDDLSDNSVHLMITSPPYFDTKMYSREPVENDLGNIMILMNGLKK